MSEKPFFAQLRDRRVIRTAVIYVALLWVALQAADLLAGAGIIDEQLVRWLILVGVAGLPIAVVVSWFVEAPWRQRRWIAVTGDLVIILGIALAAGLFAWQQWFASFTRATVAVLRIEATDLRPDTGDLAAHLALRLRTVLATRPEIRVVELDSSLRDDLADKTIAERAVMLGADYLLAGTVAQAEARIRFNVQLFAADGHLVHGETFEDRLLDQVPMQNRVLADLWPHLPLPGEALAATRDLVAGCGYPDDRDAMLAVFGVDNARADAAPAEFLAAHGDSGMLRLAVARKMFAEMPTLPLTRRPVAQRVAMQHLDKATQLCPRTPDMPLLRLANTRVTIGDNLLHQFPNSAELFRRASQSNSEPHRASAFANEAKLLDPLRDW